MQIGAQEQRHSCSGNNCWLSLYSRVMVPGQLPVPSSQHLQGQIGQEQIPIFTQFLVKGDPVMAAQQAQQAQQQLPVVQQPQMVHQQQMMQQHQIARPIPAISVPTIYACRIIRSI